MNSGQPEYSGVLHYYFVDANPSFPFRYAYGIRQHAVYPLHIIRTGPISEIDRTARYISTYDCYYQLGEEITSVDEQRMYLRIFKHRDLPIGDSEIIGPTVSIVLQ
jgi:hypothetical protein